MNQLLGARWSSIEEAAEEAKRPVIRNYVPHRCLRGLRPCMTSRGLSRGETIERNLINEQQLGISIVRPQTQTSTRRALILLLGFGGEMFIDAISFLVSLGDIFFCTDEQSYLLSRGFIFLRTRSGERQKIVLCLLRVLSRQPQFRRFFCFVSKGLLGRMEWLAVATVIELIN